MSAGIWNGRLVNIFYSFSHILSCLPVCCLLQLCMLCSVGYHLFCCHRSEKTSRRWMALDYAGVSIGILGCYVPGVFYTFYCNNVGSAWRSHSRTSCSSAFCPVTWFSCSVGFFLPSFFLWPEQALLMLARIHPVFERRCVVCCRSTRRKGGLF